MFGYDITYPPAIHSFATHQSEVHKACVSQLLQINAADPASIHSLRARLDRIWDLKDVASRVQSQRQALLQRAAGSGQVLYPG